MFSMQEQTVIIITWLWKLWWDWIWHSHTVTQINFNKLNKGRLLIWYFSNNSCDWPVCLFTEKNILDGCNDVVTILLGPLIRYGGPPLLKLALGPPYVNKSRHGPWHTKRSWLVAFCCTWPETSRTSPEHRFWPPSTSLRMPSCCIFSITKVD